MLVSGTIDQTRLTLSLKASALTLMYGTHDVLTYDLGGRLWLRFNSGVTYRRGLDGRVMERIQDRHGRRRRWLNPDEAAGLVNDSVARVRDIRMRMYSGELDLDGAEHPTLVSAVERAARFDARAAAADHERFNQIYRPVGILPPDQYLALVLQATTGCSFNTCTFCDFYKTQPFHVKTPEEFSAHVDAIAAFLGDSLTLRKSIFLGEANALAVAQPRLLPLIQIARKKFPDRPIAAFLDAFSGTKKSVAEYRELAENGLQRVSIGMESGHDPLLRFVRKPGKVANVVETVQALKAAGIAVSLIVMLGLGGDRYAQGHVQDTVAALNAMPLDRDLYLLQRPGGAPAHAVSRHRPRRRHRRTERRRAGCAARGYRRCVALW